MTLEDKGLPVSIDVEKFILGSIMGTDIEFTKVHPIVEPEDFSLETHRRIWLTMVEMHNGGLPLEGAMVGQELHKKNQLQSVGGFTYLSSLYEVVPKVHSFGKYIAILKNKSLLRKILRLNQITEERCLTESEPAEAIALTAAEAIQKLTAGAASLKPDNENPDQIVDSIGYETFCNPTALSLPGRLDFPSRWPRLVEMLPFVSPGELITIAGRPKHGKTTFALQLAGELAAKGAGILFFSLEMTKVELLTKLTCAAGRLDSVRHRKGLLSNTERSLFRQAYEKIRQCPIAINDKTGSTVQGIELAIRKLPSLPKLVIIDYLQLVSARTKSPSRNDQVSEVTRDLKVLANNLEIPIIILSQLTRANARDEREPELYDLRDSGSIEQDSNTVIFIHAKADEATKPVSMTQLRVAKQRNGPEGRVEMIFNKPMSDFSEV